jgi:hypothetical protein
MLRVIEQNPPEPTVASWRLHVLSAAMYEAWAPYDSTAQGLIYGGRWRLPAARRTDEGKAKSISYAAHRTLTSLFPFQRGPIDAYLESLGYQSSHTTNVATTEGLGNVCADGVLEFRRKDGSNADRGFIEGTSDRYPAFYQPVNSDDPGSKCGVSGVQFDANRWQPLRVANGNLLDHQRRFILKDSAPRTFTVQRFLTPHWGSVVPFAMTTAEQFRPPPPPRKGSPDLYRDGLGRRLAEDEAWNIQVDEILALSAGLSDREKAIAEFWADGPKSWTPPGHWNQIAQGIAIRDRQTLDESIRMFMALNGALLDASICCWEAKRLYDYVRPQSAIRHKYSGRQVQAWIGPDQGVGVIDGADWRPYQADGFVTPPFPEYSSGHSTFSRAAREVLLAFTGSDRFFDGVTRIGWDLDGDGEEDLLGQHRILPGRNKIERSPAETVILRWATLLEAADQAGMSRRYGGIHFQDGDLLGRRAGEQVGQQAVAVARRLWEGPNLRPRASRFSATDVPSPATGLVNHQRANRPGHPGSPLQNP